MNTVLPAPDRPVTPSRTVGLIRPAPNSPSAAVARRISSVMAAKVGTGRHIGAPELFYQRPWPGTGAASGSRQRLVRTCRPRKGLGHLDDHAFEFAILDAAESAQQPDGAGLGKKLKI